MREAGQAVLVGDRLALLGQLEPSRRVAGRLRQDRRVRRAAAAPCAATAAVEDRELDVALAGQRRERLLGAVVLPGGRQVAAVLAGVGVAEHDLEPRVRGARRARRSARRRAAPRPSPPTARRSAIVSNSGHEREVVADLRLAPGRARAGGRPGPTVPETMTVSSARGAVAGARVADGAERRVRALVRRLELVRVQPHVELRDVEAEQLDAPAQIGQRRRRRCARRGWRAGSRPSARDRRAARRRRRSPAPLGARAGSRGACRRSSACAGTARRSSGRRSRRRSAASSRSSSLDRAQQLVARPAPCASRRRSRARARAPRRGSASAPARARARATPRPCAGPASGLPS